MDTLTFLESFRQVALKSNDLSVVDLRMLAFCNSFKLPTKLHTTDRCRWVQFGLMKTSVHWEMSKELILRRYLFSIFKKALFFFFAPFNYLSTVQQMPLVDEAEIHGDGYQTSSLLLAANEGQPTLYL